METQTYELSFPLLADADAAARALGHGYVGTEHLLLAVAARREGASGRFLEQRGLTADVLRREIETVLGPVGAPAADGPLRLAQRAVLALGDSVRLGGRRAPSVSAVDALFSALLSEDVARDAVVGTLFERAGVPLAAARAEFASETYGGPDA